MKRVLSLLLVLLLTLSVVSACGQTESSTSTSTQTNSSSSSSTNTSSSSTTSTSSSSSSSTSSSTSSSSSSSTSSSTSTSTSSSSSSSSVIIPVREGITGISFTSDVKALEGTWTVKKVYTADGVKDAVADAISLRITLDLDPSELVDGPAYIHNQVYNLSSSLTFGLKAINDILAADDVDKYKGTTSWDSFVMGKVVNEGEFYEQPGPAIMSFRDIDEYGLYLNLVAGITANIDTTNKNLIIAMNNAGQLLLGYSEVHLERPSVTDGDWEYCLIFEKA